jgi:hypothetical protein
MFGVFVLGNERAIGSCRAAKDARRTARMHGVPIYGAGKRCKWLIHKPLELPTKA